MLWVFHGGPPLKRLSGGEAGKSLCVSVAPGSVLSCSCVLWDPLVEHREEGAQDFLQE